MKRAFGTARGGGGGGWMEMLHPFRPLIIWHFSVGKYQKLIILIPPLLLDTAHLQFQNGPSTALCNVFFVLCSYVYQYNWYRDFLYSRCRRHMPCITSGRWRCGGGGVGVGSSGTSQSSSPLTQLNIVPKEKTSALMAQQDSRLQRYL